MVVWVLWGQASCWFPGYPPAPMKQKHFIDSHKGFNAFAIFAMIAYFGAWENRSCWVYLALHGTYGFLWVLKSRFFGDKQWEQPCNLLFGATIWGALSLYWVSPWLLASGRCAEPPAWYLALCIALYSLGVFLHFASDMQKHLWLQLRRGHLLQEGLWSRLRNPNYLGELLIYLGFSMIPQHPMPLICLGLMVAAVWVPNMRKKDRSLSRYPEFSAYKERSWLFLPGIW